MDFEALAAVARPVQQTAVLSAAGVLTTGLLLGIRHGIDWDHIAAITDIASTTTTVEATESPQSSWARVERHALWLSFLYAVGHALVVLALGLAALSFAALLPAWIDPIMERVVGLTLVVLGVWVFYSLVQYARGRSDFRLQSRWMVVFAGVRHLAGRVRARATGHPHGEQLHVEQYGPRAALGVGMLHGIGAETGSQALLIAAVGGAADQGLGVAMLLTFTLGLVIANTLIALLASTGFITSARAKPFYLVLGASTGAFSLFLGLAFLLGVGTGLPELDAVFGFIGGSAAD